MGANRSHSLQTFHGPLQVEIDSRLLRPIDSIIDCSRKIQRLYPWGGLRWSGGSFSAGLSTMFVPETHGTS